MDALRAKYGQGLIDSAKNGFSPNTSSGAAMPLRMRNGSVSIFRSRMSGLSLLMPDCLRFVLCQSEPA
ncbi:hypothetical protein UA45_18180 [Morganella morganii]|uniref:Uncharacterized protein n=1 Tax=Morganella morganii TaxID=582 RepID=A0A0D8L5R2_MORMO|nr:hypothetical protein UA45_18180 [Morganella morganii]